MLRASKGIATHCLVLAITRCHQSLVYSHLEAIDLPCLVFNDFVQKNKPPLKPFTLLAFVLVEGLMIVFELPLSRAAKISARCPEGSRIDRLLAMANSRRAEQLQTPLHPKMIER